MAKRRDHNDCLIAVKVAGQIHRMWNPRAADSKSFARALAKLPGIEGVSVIQDRSVRQEDGNYRWQAVQHFTFGENLWDLI